MNKKQLATFLLRAGVAFAFIYPAVAAYFDPFAWIGFFPEFVRDLFPGGDMLLLHIFGATELVIGLWILIGRKILIPTALASLYLAGIVLFNLTLMDIIFRDVSILAMALALFFLEKEDKEKDTRTTTPS